jgi:hypothetical protein
MNKLLRARIDPIEDKVIGSEGVRRQGAMHRMQVREMLGDKLMREITLK